jgi:hypothetical protein
LASGASAQQEASGVPIIDQIESTVLAATNGMSRGPAREAARSFDTTAVAQLRAFKETRNTVAHMPGSFDELDA